MLPQVVAFILGRGALTLPLNFIQFAAVMLAPFMPAEIAANKVVSDSSASMGKTSAAAAAAVKQRRSFEFSPAQMGAFALKVKHSALISGAVLLA